MNDISIDEEKIKAFADMVVCVKVLDAMFNAYLFASTYVTSSFSEFMCGTFAIFGLVEDESQHVALFLFFFMLFPLSAMNFVRLVTVAYATAARFLFQYDTGWLLSRFLKQAIGQPLYNAMELALFAVFCVGICVCCMKAICHLDAKLGAGTSANIACWLIGLYQAVAYYMAVLALSEAYYETCFEPISRMCVGK